MHIIESLTDDMGKWMVNTIAIKSMINQIFKYNNHIHNKNMHHQLTKR